MRKPYILQLALVAALSATTASFAQAPRLYYQLYDAHTQTGELHLANLDGSDDRIIYSSSNRHRNPHSESTLGLIYWTEQGAVSEDSMIMRANLDGNSVQTVIPSLPNAWSVRIDAMHKKIYWLDYVSSQVRRSNLDGSSIESVLTSPSSPRTLDLDSESGKMYWDTWNAIYRANMDGSGLELLTTDADIPTEGVPIDQGLSLSPSIFSERKVYWIRDYGNIDYRSFIRRANLDGTSKMDIATIADAKWLDADALDGKIYFIQSGWVEGVGGGSVWDPNVAGIFRVKSDGSGTKERVIPFPGQTYGSTGLDVLPCHPEAIPVVTLNSSNPDCGPPLSFCENVPIIGDATGSQNATEFMWGSCRTTMLGGPCSGGGQEYGPLTRIHKFGPLPTGTYQITLRARNACSDVMKKVDIAVRPCISPDSSKYCITGTSIGVEYSWGIDEDGDGVIGVSDPQNLYANVAPAASEAPALVEYFANSINERGRFSATTMGSCMFVQPAAPLFVGSPGGTPACKVTNCSCAYNPIITYVSQAFDVPTLSAWGVCLLILAVLSVGVLVLRRRRRSSGLAGT